MKIRGIIFDLDGTLIDGYEAIHDALSYSMTTLGFEAPTLEKTKESVGRGFEELMEQWVGKDLVTESVRLFRSHYPSVALQKTYLLPGIEKVLKTLYESGYKMSVATNKPKDFSEAILKDKGILNYLTAVLGPSEHFPPKPHPKILLDLLSKMQTSPEETVCVGDMEVDVEFARAGGCRVIVVPTGSRSKTFLQQSGADFLIDTLEQLPLYLKSEKHL